MGERGAIIDLDGTVYHAGEPIDGAADGIATLREAGYDVLFLTNSAVRTREEVRSTLQDAGIDASEEDILTSGSATAAYLRDEHAGKAAYVLGPAALATELRQAGVRTVDAPDEADVIVASQDRDLTYDRLQRVLRGYGEDTVLVGTNPDPSVPGTDGPVPGAGTIVRAVETMVEDDATVVGKPSERMARVAMDQLGTAPERTILVGDRIGTDIRMGETAGVTTVLVMSGSTSEAMLSESKVEPDHVLPALGDIKTVLE